jgi:SAM-dependent methyltransferase
VRSGRLDPAGGARAIDLGCGSGANAVFLAESGFDVTGVDFSTVALDKARALAAKRGVSARARFVAGDLTANGIPGVDPADLVVDYGTLDDLRGEKRRAMARLIRMLVRPGGAFLLWCFYGSSGRLPLISFNGPSKLSGAIRPGEEATLFDDMFDIERLPEPGVDTPFACFLMTRR